MKAKHIIIMVEERTIITMHLYIVWPSTWPKSANELYFVFGGQLIRRYFISNRSTI
jgi:hypothetical protein